MATVSDYLTSDHRACDERLAAAEHAAARGEWEGARSAFDTLREAMERHFRMEEDVLFPRVESATGQTTGPTAVMRDEHLQMRALLADMTDAAAARDADAFLDACETLLIMVQQHNLKEEEVLYPLSDEVLGPEGETVLEQMRAL